MSKTEDLPVHVPSAAHAEAAEAMAGAEAMASADCAMPYARTVSGLNLPTLRPGQGHGHHGHHDTRHALRQLKCRRARAGGGTVRGLVRGPGLVYQVY